ncbi:MAG: HAD-IA family hydrolase [Lapillicoccus sp.]
MTITPVPSSPRPRWPVAVFDLDGTLVDTIALIVASYQHAFREVLGEEQDETRIRGWIGQPLIRAFSSAWPDQADALFASYIAWNRANTERLIRSYAGLTDVLAELTSAGVQIAAATSKLRAPALEAARLTGVAPHLALLVSLEDTEQHKPDPAPLLLAVDRLGAVPATAVYVGDAVVDVQAARAAGMGAVAVSWGAGDRDDLVAARPDVLVDTPHELRAALLPGGAS